MLHLPLTEQSHLIARSLLQLVGTTEQCELPCNVRLVICILNLKNKALTLE